MKTIIQQMKNCKLATKMFVTFIIGVLLPILITQILSFHENLKFMTEKVNELTTNNLSQIAERTDLTLDVYTNLLYQIYVDDDISENINILTDEENSQKAAAYNHLFNRMRQYDMGEEGARSICIICENGMAITYDYLTGSSLDTLWSDYKNMQAIPPYKDAQDKIGMVVSPTMKFNRNGQEQYYFHISKRIYDLHNLEKGSNATVVMSIDADVLNDICNGSNRIENSNDYGITFILNEDRQIISYPDNMFMGTILDDQVSIEKLVQLSGRFKNKEIVINDFYDSTTGWTFYSVYDKDFMFQDIREAQKVFFSVGIIALLFASILIIFMIRNILHAVSNVIHGINQVKEGKLDVKVPIECEDEIGQIAHNFNEMTEEVQRLITEMKTVTEKQKNAEIRALEAQINPHFLYNTLDSINWMAIEKGEYEISNMLRNLGVILRYSVNKSNQKVTVREMVDWIDKYISLQQVRFNHAFDYKLSIDESLLEKKLFKLLLQPFIENAIIHGFCGVEHGGLLRIDFIKEEDAQFMCIILEDNGIGMSKEMVELYNDREKAIEVEGEHIGLHNAFARMHMYYGKKVSWNIISMEDMGTVITMRIPMEE